jgi:hypothetical protein
VTATDKTLILGFLLTGLVTYGTIVDREESPQRAVSVRSNGRLAYRLPATDASRESDATVIEQPDGLLVIDDSLSPGPASSTVARIMASSAKPVKFLIHSHDRGVRSAQDRDYRDAWPNIVIISTADEAPTSTFRGAASSVLSLGRDYARDRLARLGFAPAFADTWRAVAETVQSVMAVYRRLSQTRIRLSATASNTEPCMDG